MENFAAAWSQPSAVRYYAEHRHELSEAYPSERIFLPRVLFPGAKVLDVGCASGGFFNIMRSIEPLIDYTGIDIAEPSIELARRKYPEARFQVSDGTDIPFADGDFDLVHCTSILVNEPRHKEILSEMYRVSNRFVLVDIRLLKDAGKIVGIKESSYPIQYEGEYKGIRVPYVIADADETLDLMLSFDPPPQAVRGTGYYHAIPALAATPVTEVCMAVFLIQKGGNKKDRAVLDLAGLPIEFAVEAGS